MNFNILLRVSLCTFICSTSAAVAVPPPANLDIDPLLNAIQKVETGGCKNPSEAVGDGGKAIGPFQIHEVYWRDAVEHDPSIGGKYTDCKDPAYARKIVIAYCSRYAPNWNAETIARIHNGGPKGHKKSATVKYWRKVDNNLRQSAR